MTFIAEMALETDLIFALIVLSAFALFPLTLRAYRRWDSVGAVLVGAMFFKLLFVSQWIKVFHGQAAHTFLEDPIATVMALVLGMVGFTVAGWLSGVIASIFPWRVMKPDHDTDLMLRLGIAAAGLGLLGEVVRHVTAANLDPSQELEGSGGSALWSYLSSLSVFSVTILTARRMLLSNGQRAVDGLIITGILLCTIDGIIGNSRTILFSGIIGCILAYFAYGGRVRAWQGALGVLGIVLVQNVIFPLVDLQRQLPKEIPFEEYISRTSDFAVGLLTGISVDPVIEERLMIMYQSWDTRQYYGSPSGFLDRFSPSQVDEIVTYVNESKPAGFFNAFLPFSRAIPPGLLRIFNLKHPDMGGRMMQSTVSRVDIYTAPNYGVIGELFFYGGMEPLVQLIVITMVPFFCVFHILYGGYARNYIGSFAGSIFFLTITDGETAELYGRLVEQGGLYALLYLGGSFIVRGLRRG